MLIMLVIATHCLSLSHLRTVTKKLLGAFVLSRLDYRNSLLAGCPKFLLSKLQKVQNNAANLIFTTKRSAHVTHMLHSLHLNRGSNTNCLCFALRSYLIRLSSTYQNFFAFTPSRQLRSSIQTPECSEHHPSELSPVVSTLFSYPAPVIWNQLPVSVRRSTSASSFKSSL